MTDPRDPDPKLLDALAHRQQNPLSSPGILVTADFVIQNRRFNVSCGIGISIYPDHGVDNETLIKNADAAMYGAKESGRNAFRFFTDEMNVQVMERLAIEYHLRSALENKEFFLVYQPQIDLSTSRNLR